MAHWTTFSSTALIIQNGTASSISTLTLNTLANATSGANASDLLYVASGGTLTIQNGSSGTLNVALAASGNFDTVGNATISSVISWGSIAHQNRIVTGTLTLNGANTFSGAVAINAGTLATNNLATSTGAAQGLGDSGLLTLNGGTLQYTANTAVNAWATGITVNAGGGTLNNSGNQAVFLSGALFRFRPPDLFEYRCE